MNDCPEEVEILFRSYGSISFKIEVSAEVLEINWGDGDILTQCPEGWLTIEHEFDAEGEFLVQIKGKRIAGLNVARLNLVQLLLHCPRLEYLDCSVNELSELDLSHCPVLEELYCNSNNIENLLLSKHFYLLQANVSYNRLKKLDVSGCISLRALYGSANCLVQVRLNAESPLSYLDLGSNLLDGDELNSIFQHFAPKYGKGIIHYMQNPGTDLCDTSFLKTKVYL